MKSAASLVSLLLILSCAAEAAAPTPGTQTEAPVKDPALDSLLEPKSSGPATVQPPAPIKTKKTPKRPARKKAVKRKASRPKAAAASPSPEAKPPSAEPSQEPAPEEADASQPSPAASTEPAPQAKRPLATSVRRRKEAPPKPSLAEPSPSAYRKVPPPSLAALPSAEDARDLASSAGISLSAEVPAAVGAVFKDSPAQGFGLSDTVFYLDSKGAVKSRRPILDTSLKAGDTLLYLAGRKIAGTGDVAKALMDWLPGTRLSAVISRAGVLQSLSTRLPDPESPLPRDPAVLTPRETLLRDAVLADASAPQRAEPLRASSFHIPAGERIWLRFPKGIPKTARQGDILEAETTTPMATDSELDFLALPPGSRLWAQVVTSKEDGPVQSIRLHFYKIRPANGRTYQFSAILKNVASDSRLLRVSEGGTLVAAPPEESTALVGPDVHLEARLLRSLTLYEPEQFYQAGAGLWFKDAGRGKSDGLEITHIIPQRSAEQAGLKTGDLVISVGGRLTSGIGFSESIGTVYGAPGTSVQLRVRRSGQSRAEVLSLRRGMRFQKGLGIRAKAASGALTVTRVFPGSPADRAGLKEGDRLLKAGERDLASMSREDLSKLFAESLTGDNVLSYEPAGGKSARKASISQAVYGVQLEVKTELRDVPNIQNP